MRGISLPIRAFNLNGMGGLIQQVHGAKLTQGTSFLC